MDVMRLGLPRRDQLLANEQREWQIDQLVTVHVPQFAAAEAQFDAAEAVQPGRHPGPRQYLSHDRLLNGLRLLDGVAHWSPPPAPGLKIPRGAAGGSSTTLPPLTAIVSPDVSGGACCTASKFTSDDS